MNFPNICTNCLRKLKPYLIEFKVNGVHGSAVYVYDDMVKNMIFQYKACHDYELNKVFLNHIRNDLRILYFWYHIVPMPSYFEEDIARGFNHVEEIFKNLNLPMLKVLKKNKRHKQSDLSYEERKSIKEVLEIENGELLTGKNILLVDDICTTGASLSAAVDLIRKYKPKNIEIFVVAKREFTKEEKEIISKKVEIV